jgi:hypothetical protein
MDEHFKNPCITGLLAGVDLDLRVMACVLEKSKEFPPLLTVGRSAPVVDVGESVYRKWRVELGCEPLVGSCDRLVAFAARCRIDKNIAFNAVVIWVLPKDTRVGHGGHHNQAAQLFVLAKAWTNSAGVSYPQSLIDFLVCITLPDAE